ncbi:MAG: S8 family serine peptidase [Bacteroidales bacterium]|nr:S8 family serine peptidase [Bacteroidales bacterium]MDD4175470.1 S8 family serine peptidase [Bacteroidales bacterium]
MKRLTTVILLLLLAGTLTTLTGQSLLTTQLATHLEQVSADDMVRINITLKERYDSQQLLRHAQTLRGEARRQYVVAALKDFSNLSQRGVVAQLNQQQRSQQVHKVTTYWIANVINCYATPAAIAQLADRHDIESIDYDEVRLLLDPAERKNAVAVEGVPGSREITWNVLKINADDVWALGFNGDGIIVSVIDTGVNYDHLDLQGNVWQSDEYPKHGYDFVNNDNDPKDDNGHGTHCAGTVAGNGASGSQTGVAPAATIMCLKVLDAGGSGNESGVWSAIQFSVEQGAHVMSLSLGWLHDWGPNRRVWRESFDNSLAAGIVASVAAGNEGDQQYSYPIPDNVRTPGDLPPPWLHPDQTLTGGVSGIICVGATTSSNQLSGFSGRGPVDWSSIAPFNDYPYQPEIGLIRPDLCAPGSNIKSLAYNSNTGYEDGWSGTSMATPANAGMIALMLQKNNLLSPEQISQISEETAQVMTPGKNNNTGSGRIDALAAVNAVPLPGPSYYAHSINDASGNNNGIPEPGEAVLLTLAMANFSDAPASNVTVAITTQNPYITLTDSIEYFGDFALEDIIEIADAYAFEVANNIPGGEQITINVTAYSDDESWESKFVITAHGVLLSAGGMTINDFAGNNNGNLDPGEVADLIIPVSNLGQIDAEESMAWLSTASPWITINSVEFDLETLEAGGSTDAVFNITVSPVAPIGTMIDLALEVTSGYYELTQLYTPKVGLIVEDFETGDFSKFPWQFVGSSNWTIVGSEVYEGDYAAKSGAIGNSAQTEMKLVYEVASNDTISFYRKVSSENNYDWLRFYIDNTKVGEWSGEVAWSRVAFPVTAGEHTFRWQYIKDIYVSSGSDCAWVDYIELPANTDATMSVYAGVDGETCAQQEFTISAIALNYETALWSTSGDGTFADSSLLETTYMPGDQDAEEGIVTLWLTVYGNDQSLTDSLQLTVFPLPETPGAINGLDMVCNYWVETYSIAPLAATDTYQWILLPEEAGTLVSTNGYEAEITWTENYYGEVTLAVQGYNDCGFGELSETLTILVDQCIGVSEPKASDPSLTPNPNNGYFTIETAGDAQMTITDLSGKTLYEGTVQQGANAIDAQWLQEGFYLMTLKSPNQIYTTKLVIRK